jgi:hypothetical protein
VDVAVWMYSGTWRWVLLGLGVFVLIVIVWKR